MSKILYVVAVDGSDWGDRAADRAITLAEKVNASVKLITVVDWSYLQQPMIMEGGVNLPILDKTTEEKNITNSVLVPLLEKYKHSDVGLTAELIWGDPVDEINEHVKKTHANMLFVGRQGRSRIVDMLLGSVANKLAHTVGIPIVLVP
jgi:nucleotide-binding universal stress UspA family protein